LAQHEAGYAQQVVGTLESDGCLKFLSVSVMADASAVMKEWRRLQTASPSTPTVAVPDQVQKAGQAAITALWTEAQALAQEALNVAQAAWDTERTEAEKQRVELSAAYDAQAAELDTLRARLSEVETQATAAAAREDAAQLRGQAETLQAQNAELMEALKLREPKAGKKPT
jgi:hypothetical protein